MYRDRLFISTSISWLLLTSLAKAQTPPILLPPQPEPAQPEVLPPLEEVLPQLDAPETTLDEIDSIPQTVFIKKFVVTGSTVFTAAELAKVLKPYSLRRLNFAEILAAQQAIDRLYLENGYLTSGTVLPPQRLADRIVTIEVIEGTLDEINITGLTRLQPGYVRSRIEKATQAPLNRDRLLNALQLLQLDPLIANLSAELTAGANIGSSILELNLQEADPFDLTLAYDNFRSPSVGTDRRQVSLTHRNLLGFGDRFSLGYLNTDGSDSLNDFSYTLPINASNGTLSFRLGYTDSEIIEKPFEEFNLESENTNYELIYRQPILQKPIKDLALGLSFSRNDSFTSTDGEPFQLSRGAEINGETDISTLRFFQEYTTRNAQQVLALRSQFSLGVGLFDATINSGDTPDSNFLAWRGQAQYLRSLGSRFTLLLRSDFQASDRPLVPVEQFSLGGALSIRGYRQDALLGDNGLFSSAELRATVAQIPSLNTSIQLTPFLDFGSVWSRDDLTFDTNTLVSTGIGLRIQTGDYLAARIDYGIPLVDLDSSGDSLQEEGVYFSLELKPF